MSLGKVFLTQRTCQSFVFDRDEENNDQSDFEANNDLEDEIDDDIDSKIDMY